MFEFNIALSSMLMFASIQATSGKLHKVMSSPKSKTVQFLAFRTIEMGLRLSNYLAAAFLFLFLVLSSPIP